MHMPNETEVADRSGRIGLTAFITNLDSPTVGVPVVWSDDGTSGTIPFVEVTWYPLGTDPTEW
jgi:hypothetical protein